MKEIKLFDYQEDMKERIEKALRLHRSVMAQMPTGTGKTVLLASVVESFLREHSNSNIWIVAHRRELVSQIRETIERVFSKTHPSSLTLKGGSTAFPKPLSPQGTGDVTALRCSEPLRSKVGGASKPSPDCLSAGAFNVPIKAVSIQWLSNSYKHDEYYPVDNLCPVQAWLSEHPKGRRLVLCEPLVIKTHNRSRWLFLLLLF